MKLTLIAQGSSKWQRFIKRWGVSFLIGDNVLFDTFGRADVFRHNIKRLNIDINRIQHVVLSHDDWDHISGLWYLLKNRKDIKVYVCPGFKQEIKERIVSFGADLIETAPSQQIVNDVYTTGELYSESGERKIFEQSLALKTSNGFALICGCAHPGVDSIVKRASNFFSSNVNVLIGGFHLKDNLDKTNKQIVENLKQAGVRKIMPMHCTGKRAVELIRSTFGSGFSWLREGDYVEL